MYHFIVLVVAVVAVAARPNIDDMPACGKVAHSMQCCNKEMPKKLPPPEEIKECFQLAKKPPSCDLEMCIAKKRGVASDDGTIDKKKMAEEVEQRFENDPELIDSLKVNCINGDLSKYGPSDFCELMKQKLCFDVQFVKSCSDWRDDGECSGIKNAAAQCISQFP